MFVCWASLNLLSFFRILPSRMPHPSGAKDLFTNHEPLSRYIPLSSYILYLYLYLYIYNLRVDPNLIACISIVFSLFYTIFKQFLENMIFHDVKFGQFWQVLHAFYSTLSVIISPMKTWNFTLFAYNRDIKLLYIPRDIK